MKSKWRWQWIISSWLLVSSVIYGEGITFPSRLIYLSTARQGVAATITNQSQTDYLLQCWVAPIDSQGHMSQTGKAPFVVTPPLLRLDAGESQTIRIRRLQQALPEDRESLFYLATKMIPGKTHQAVPLMKQGTFQMQMVMVYGVKLFYRPAGLLERGGVLQALGKVKLFTRGKELLIRNPSAYYLTFSEIKAGQQRVPASELMKMVAPFDQTSYRLGAPLTKTNLVALRAIDEAGQATPETTVTISDEK